MLLATFLPEMFSFLLLLPAIDLGNLKAEIILYLGRYTIVLLACRWINLC